MTKLDSDLQEMEVSFEIASLNKQIENLSIENQKLKKALQDNDIEIEGIKSELSDEELICVNEIKKLKHLSDIGSFTQEEAKTLDILYKNLRLIRGLHNHLEGKSKSNSKIQTSELFKIVTNEKT